MVSNQLAHPGLIREADFVRAQQISAIMPPDDANPRRYQLTGLVICGLCGRRSEGHWANGRARYRCRHGSTSGRDATVNRIPTLYLREDQILSQAVAQLGDADRDDIPGLLRARRITIVCTAVSTVLDIPATASGSGGPTGPIQPAIPGLEVPIQRRRRGTPTKASHQT